MPRLHHQVRVRFEAALEESGDYREACRVAGVAERTGRRWRQHYFAHGGAEGPALRSEDSPTASASSFEGRRRDLALLRAMLERGERLVTVLGPPGIGKTRVARQLLRIACPRPFRGIEPVFCDLRSLTSRQEVVVEVGRALGFDLLGTGGADEPSLGAALAARGPCLIVLDNLESVTTEAARLVGEWLRSVPRVAFLATSRCVLGLRSEVAHELHPLSLPSLDAKQNPWSESEAMRLFRARALAAEPALRAADLAARDVANLVRRLDGVPLAIELAATQMRRVDLGQLLAEVEERLLNLEDEAVDSDPRHRSLRATIEQSYALLSPVEQRVLAQLSVFKKGFTADAADAVIKPPGTSRPLMAKRLRGLREASMLRVEPRLQGPRRWDLFEVIREFANERLQESGLASETSDRHASFYERLGREWVAALQSERGVDARRRLKCELENLRAAYERCVSRGDAPATLRMALILFEAVVDVAPTYAAAVVSRSLDVARDLAPDVATELVIPLLIRRSIARRETSDLAGAQRDLTAAKAVLGHHALSPSEPGPWRFMAEIEYHQGLCCFYQGLYPDARRHLEEALERTANGGKENTYLEGQILSALATVRAEGFRDETALTLLSRAVATLERSGTTSALAWARYWLCAMRYNFRRTPPLKELEHHIDTANAHALNIQETHFRYLHALVVRDLGRLADAQAEMETVVRQCEKLGLVRLRWCGAFTLGPILELQGLIDEAAVCYENAIAGLAACGDRRNEGYVRICASGVMARQGNLTGAAQRLDEAEVLLAQSGDARAAELVQLQRAHVDLALARRAIRGGEASEAVVHQRRARNRAEAIRRPHETGVGARMPLEGCSSEARILLKVLDRELSAARNGDVSLRVARDGSSFSYGQGSARSLPDGDLIRRLFLILLQQRESAPGVPVSSTELLRRCWVGQQFRSGSGKLRVRGLIRRLRQAGLEGLLLTGKNGGYFLDPGVVLEWENSKPKRRSTLSASET